MKKKLFTCGDSYMSLDYPAGKITSFLAKYADYKNFEHISLARAGATVLLIRLQIEYAIACQADYVIVGCTSSDRIDVPVCLDKDAINHLTLNNVLLKGYKSQVETSVSQDKVMVVSDTIFNILHSRHESIVTEDQKSAIKSYVAYLHDPGLQRQENFYVLSDGFRKLQQVGIPFVYIPHGMAYMDWSWIEKLWPLDDLPCMMPNGPYDYNITVTHNDQLCHDRYFETLKTLTQDWT